MAKAKGSLYYSAVIAVGCSLAAVGVHIASLKLYVLLIGTAAAMTVLMLIRAWKYRRNYATISWVYFLTSLLSIMLMTDSVRHLIRM